MSQQDRIFIQIKTSDLIWEGKKISNLFFIQLTSTSDWHFAHFFSWLCHRTSLTCTITIRSQNRYLLSELKKTNGHFLMTTSGQHHQAKKKIPSNWPPITPRVEKREKKAAYLTCLKAVIMTLRIKGIIRFRQRHSVHLESFGVLLSLEHKLYNFLLANKSKLVVLIPKKRDQLDHVRLNLTPSPAPTNAPGPPQYRHYQL